MNMVFIPGTAWEGYRSRWRLFWRMSWTGTWSRRVASPLAWRTSCNQGPKRRPLHRDPPYGEPEKNTFSSSHHPRKTS